MCIFLSTLIPVILLFQIKYQAGVAYKISAQKNQEKFFVVILFLCLCRISLGILSKKMSRGFI